MFDTRDNFSLEFQFLSYILENINLRENPWDKKIVHSVFSYITYRIGKMRRLSHQ